MHRLPSIDLDLDLSRVDIAMKKKSEIIGSIRLRQKSPDYPLRFDVDVRGLASNSLHGFHIHEKQMTPTSDWNASCQQCGGHFNPTSMHHGHSFDLSTMRFRNKDVPRHHVGDLINNIKTDAEGRAKVSFEIHYLTLYDPDPEPAVMTKKWKFNICGRSIVVHEGTDDLGLGVTCQVMPYLSPSLFDANRIKLHVREEVRSYAKAYKNAKMQTDSIHSGNAGKRLACLNIPDVNIKGGILESCSLAGMALTGFTRTGHCSDQVEDVGTHHVCIDLDTLEFCRKTGQSNWCDIQSACQTPSVLDIAGAADVDVSVNTPTAPHATHAASCPKRHWCVCQWAFKKLVDNASPSDKLAVIPEATNLRALEAYVSQEKTGIDNSRVIAALQS